jgi:maltokinase-like protein
MALLYDATLTPSKMTLVRGWLPDRPWFQGEGKVRKVGAYRFDDPAGEVGMEAFLVHAEVGPVMHVPMTYRGAPLEGAEDSLIGTTEHSVLGTRWVYDACGDPVWAAALATTVLSGGTEAEQVIEEDGRMVAYPSSATVRGSGSPDEPPVEVDSVTCRDDEVTTMIDAGDLELVVVRVVGADVAMPYTLTGRWDGGEGILAGLGRVIY